MSNARKFCIGYTVGILAFGIGRLFGDTPAVALNPFIAGMAMGVMMGCIIVAFHGDSKCD